MGLSFKKVKGLADNIRRKYELRAKGLTVLLLKQVMTHFHRAWPGAGGIN